MMIGKRLREPSIDSDDPSVCQDIQSGSEDDTVLNISQLKDIQPKIFIKESSELKKGSSLST